MSENSETAVIAGGCFWCLEAALKRVKGVVDAVSGYAGGARPNPSYEQVCSGASGHAEVVSVTFDPQQISYSDILQLFFNLHDPTTLNRQGADVGTQYRSAIFPLSDSQREAAQEAISTLDASGEWPNSVVTTIEQADKIYPAEAYHQDYFINNPGNGYCQMVVAPKLQKFLIRHSDKISDS